jgi:hypothetical protein
LYLVFWPFSQGLAGSRASGDTIVSDSAGSGDIIPNY